nr:hypothetical protein [Pseudodesulfovibrio sp.]
MQIFFTAMLISALMIGTFTARVYAEDQPHNPIEIKGLVVNSEKGLTINDGTQEYLLLGVDDIGIEGRTCIIFGDLIYNTEMPVIDVFEVHLSSDEFLHDDNIGIDYNRQFLTRTVQYHSGHARQLTPCGLACWYCANRTFEQGKNDVSIVGTSFCS